MEHRGVWAAGRRAIGRLWLMCPLVCGLLWMAGTTAHASSDGGISLTPSSGPVGTHVQVFISLSPDTPTTYALHTTTVAPTSNGCDVSSSQPIPDAQLVTVTARGGTTEFDWPAQLSSGPYWLCAVPSSSGIVATSATPFVVTHVDGTAVATATPVPTPTISVTTPADRIVPGATLTLALANWDESISGAPSTVALVENPDALRSISREVPVTAASHDGSAYTVSIVLPSDVVPGVYAITVYRPNGQVSSRAFSVLSASGSQNLATPTSPATTGATRATGTRDVAPETWVIGGLVVLLLVLTLVLSTRLLIRTPARKAQPTHAERSGASGTDTFADSEQEWTPARRDPRSSV